MHACPASPPLGLARFPAWGYSGLRNGKPPFMLTVLLTIVVASAPDGDSLPIARATLLRETGCWLEWEGEVPLKAGVASIRLPNHIDPSTLVVERKDGAEWRSTDFSISS